MVKPLIIDNEDTNYLIDSDGYVINKITNKRLIGSIKNGYRSVKLTIKTKKKDFLVHRLVALCFLDNPLELPQVNHKDGNKLNNNVNNLEWISYSQNIVHSYTLPRKTRKQQQQLIEDVIHSDNWKQYLNTNYYFSTDGRGANIKTQKYLNPSMTPEGYLRFSLYINQQSKSILAHKLIYMTYFPDDEIKKNEQINHKDGNKQNNCITNLEKISNQENMIHSYYILQQNTVKIRQYDLSHNLIKEYDSISKAAEETGFNISGISQAASKKNKTYKHYLWEKV